MYSRLFFAMISVINEYFVVGIVFFFLDLIFSYSHTANLSNGRGEAKNEKNANRNQT